MKLRYLYFCCAEGGPPPGQAPQQQNQQEQQQQQPAGPLYTDEDVSQVSKLLLSTLSILT